MNILMALSQLEITGAEVYATTIADELIERGNKVYIVSDTLTTPTKAEYIKLEFNKRSLLKRIEHIKFLYKLIKEKDIQIVHAHSRASSWSCQVACKLAGIPLITTTHGRQPIHFSRKLIKAFGDYSIAVCENIKKHMVNDIGFSENKVSVIPNPVNYKKLDLEKKVNNKKIISIVGRLSGPKGDVAYDLLEILSQDELLSKYKIRLIGGKELPERFLKFKEKDIEFIGYVLNIQEKIFESDIVIGAGRVAFEALLNKTSLIAVGETEYIGFINKENLDNLKSEKEDVKLKIDSLQKIIYLNKFDVRKITEKIDEINNYKENHQGFTSDKEKELILYKEKSILIDDEINKYNLEINKLKNLVLEMEKNEIIVINNLDSIERDINILDNSKNILLENKNSNESKLKLKESELIESELQLKNNLSEIELIEQLNVEFNLKTDELTNSISTNTHLRKKLILNNEEISKRYSELSEKSLTLEKEIEKNELRISNLKEQFSNLINRLCDEYSLTLEDCERKMELYKNEHFTKEELKRLKEDLRELGSFSYDSIEEFEKVKNELEFQKNQEIDLQNSIEDINKIILKLENTMKKTFINEFKTINENFSNIFKILFNGGEARLELDSEDILNCGIDIIAKPVGKKMQTLSLMSGGEKSLTAVALLFAIFETKPSPFCILDEVDAALDDSNILRYVEYLKNYLTETQFIMITHRKPTMEMADMIYGVTMEQKGVSKIVSMTFNKEKK